MSDIDDACATCGKRSDGLKKCTACKLVKYCNATCQKAHRSAHKKECRKRAKELHEEALFRQPETPDDCPICFLPLSYVEEQSAYQTCCGKFLCIGCVNTVEQMESGWESCAFCRVDRPSREGEVFERLEDRLEKYNDPTAGFSLGICHANGKYGLSEDREKAHEYYLRAAKLSSSQATFRLSLNYYNGDGCDVDKAKAWSYLEEAAIMRHLEARTVLGEFDVID